MKKVLVLGAGRVGGLIARDLASDPAIAVTVADRDAAALDRIRGRVAAVESVDAADDRAVESIAGRHDLIVGAVPGFLGLRCVRAALRAGRPMVDISFMPEDPCAFDAEAKARGVPVIVDCGVAPGLSNFAVGRAASAMDEVDRVRILVGGLPVVRRRPWEYAAVFSPIDVLEEYTRPVRKVVGGETTTTEPLMEPERIDVEGVGTLEAFDTDGLRSLVRTVPARHMVEKTMRWPGHRDRILLLREAGFLRTDPVEAGGVSVRPIDLTARLLIDDWRLEEGAEELTVLLVTVEGKRGGTPVRRSFRLIDRTDRATGDTSMARTTGFPAAIAARWLLDGTFREAGVHPPEVPGRNPDLWARMLAALADRGVRIEET